MPGTIRRMLHEQKEEHRKDRQALQEETMISVLRDLIAYERQTLTKMKGGFADESARLHPEDNLNLSVPSQKTRGELLDRFEALRKDTLSFLTRRLPQDWEHRGRDPSAKTLRQHTIDLTEHDRDARNQLSADIEIQQ